MNKIVLFMLVFMLVIVAAPAYSNEVIQIYECQMLEGATDDDIRAVSAEWLKAAKKMKGGEQLVAHVRYPIVGKLAESDFSFILSVPSLEEWSAFTSGYEGSELEIIDDKMDKFCDCPNSSLWEIEKLE